MLLVAAGLITVDCLLNRHSETWILYVENHLLNYSSLLIYYAWLF